MSYILQALKRAQDERESGVVATRPRATTVAGSLRRSWWPWVIAAALLVNAGALLVFSRSERTATRVEPEGEGSGGAPAAQEWRPTGPDSEGSPRDRGPVTGPSASTLTAASSRTGESRDGRGRPRPPESARLTDSSGAPRRAAPAESRLTSPTRPSEPAPRAVLTQPIEPPPRTAPAPPSEPPPAIPPSPYPAPGSLAPPPAPPAPAAHSLREAFQALILQALVYADVRSQRMVFINGRKYVEGDTLAEGFVLEQVTPEGAVLTAGGERFLLRERGR